MSSQRFKIFTSTESHYSLKKGAVALGFGTDSIVSGPVSPSGKMNSERLKFLIKQSIASGETPLLVCATAGTTVLGAFDPIEEIAPICKQYGVWLRVDGDWGWPAIFSKKMSASMIGVEKADSFTFDAHKLFGAGLTCSFLLTRHKNLLLEANDVSGGDYLFHSDDPTIDRGKASWQCGKRADAVSFWTIWKSLGTDGLQETLDRLISIRDETVLWIKKEPRLELICEPEYLNVCVRLNPPSRNWSRKVREHLKEQNQAMVNFSKNQDSVFLRLIFAHPHLEFEHLREILDSALGVLE